MTTLRFTIRSLPDGHLKSLYQRLSDKEPAHFSVVFNALFNVDEEQGNRLSDYDSALVAAGAVVSVSEIYGDTMPDNGASVDQNAAPNDLMMTTVEVLLQSITYVGGRNYRKELYVNY